MQAEQSIDQIKKLPNGSSVSSLIATIAEVKPQKTVNGARGPVTVQGLKLTQGNDFIFADAWGHSDMSNLQGQTFVINSVARNGTISGLSVKEKVGANGAKTYINLVISKSAVFHPLKQGQPAPSRQSGPVIGHAGHSDEGEVKERLNKYANLYTHCLVAGTYVKNNYAGLGGQMTDEQFQACVSALFINASKDGLQGLVKIGPFLPEVTAEPVSDPAPSTAAEQVGQANEDEIPY
jgi:hypothetical protein